MSACQLLRTLFGRMRPTEVGSPTSTEVASATPLLVCRTHDEVNAALARSWCDDNGLEFRLASQRDPLLPPDAQALVLDVNHLGLDARERREFVERLCQLLPPYPVAIASYDLRPGIKRLLAARGWLISRHVRWQIFYELAAALGENCRPPRRRLAAGEKIRRNLFGKMLQYR